MPLGLNVAFRAGLLLALLPTLAAAAATPPTTGDRVRESVLQMTDFFDTMLPGVLAKNNLTLHVHPKFSDLRRYEYIRFPFELRYGLTERWELLGGLVPFVPNPFNRGREHRWGPGEFLVGARRDLGATLGFFDATTAGVEVRVPWGHPPAELNDHYTHLKPYVTASRTLSRWPSTTFYANAAYDRSVDLTHRAAPPPGVTRRNLIEVAPGLLYRPSELAYFAEYRIRHVNENAGWHLSHEIQFGTIWEVPLARSEARGLPGKWQLELAYRVSHEEGRDRDHGISARVNWRTTLRQVMERGKNAGVW